ncbi:hypothetical protein MMC26_007071 [Xylographa opegraphella]|nr:hypothetical protein [Xylographa opegraphella]
MKVVICGASGLVGGEALIQCLSNKAITSVLALTRRPLATELLANSKVTNILHEDFSHYPDSLIDQLAGSEACLWAIGGMNAKFSDAATARTVNVEYTLAAAHFFATAIAPALSSTGKKFRFVYCSGWGTENDLKKPLWWMQDSRRIKGEAENGLFALAKDNEGVFEVLVVRPAGILPRGMTLTGMLLMLGPSVKVEAVGAVMVEMAINGFEKRTLENGEIVKRGKELLLV